MIRRDRILELLKNYDMSNLSIATICSHSALQIFHGARLEGFKTIGICLKDRVEAYNAFPLARPDEYIEVEEFSDILLPEFQDRLRSKNAIIVAHGSFVEYLGADNLLERFEVPMYGNRMSLIWEADRQRQREWLSSAGLSLPRELPEPYYIDRKVFVKFYGAKGGRGFFTASSNDEFEEKLKMIRNKGIAADNLMKFVVEEFAVGVRYYIHYFLSKIDEGGLRVGDGRLELMGMDKRIEPIDESYRGLPKIPDEYFDYTVTGNQPVVIRESLLPEVMDMGKKVVEVSQSLFDPGLIGPFCLETIYHPDSGFKVFEISARIVAGTNLYPLGSPYSPYMFELPMSTGRRIAMEINKARWAGRLNEIIY